MDSARAILLTYDCEYDKTDTVLIAKVRDLSEIDEGGRGLVRSYKVSTTFYLEARQDMPESYIDLRSISRIQKSIVEGYKGTPNRVASLKESAQFALQQHLSYFLGYDRDQFVLVGQRIEVTKGVFLVHTNMRASSGRLFWSFSLQNETGTQYPQKSTFKIAHKDVLIEDSSYNTYDYLESHAHTNIPTCVPAYEGRAICLVADIGSQKMPPGIEYVELTLSNLGRLTATTFRHYFES